MREMHVWGDIMTIVRLARRANMPDDLRRRGGTVAFKSGRQEMYMFTFLQTYRRARLAARRHATPGRCNMQAALLPFLLR